MHEQPVQLLDTSSEEEGDRAPQRVVSIPTRPKEELEGEFKGLSKAQKMRALGIVGIPESDLNDDQLIEEFNKRSLEERNLAMNVVYQEQKRKHNPEDFESALGERVREPLLPRKPKPSWFQENPKKTAAIAVVSFLVVGGLTTAVVLTWQSTPAECKNTKYDFAFDWTTDFSNGNCDVQMNLYNTGNENLTLTELAFKTPSSFNLSNLPNGTIVNQNGDEYILTFAQPLVIKPSEKFSLGRALASLPNDPETYAKSLITIPHSFKADSNGTKLSGGFLNRQTCPINNPIGQLFAVRLMPDDGALPTNANVDPRVNSFVQGYLYQFPNSGVVKGFNIPADNALNAAVQRYKEEHPNTNVTLDALLFDIRTLTTDPSKMETFLNSVENAIDMAGGGKAVDGIILSSAHPANMNQQFEDDLIALHKAVKERFLLTHPTTHITINIPFNQTYSSKAAIALNENVNSALVTNSKGSSPVGTKVGDAMTNVPYTEQNINKEFAHDKIIQEQGDYSVFYHAEDKINPNNVTNNKIGQPLMEENLVKGVYSPCSLKNGIENISNACTSNKMAPLPNASKYKKFPSGNSYNNIMFNEEDNVVGIGTIEPENLKNIKAGDKVISTLAFNGQTLETNNTFVSTLADRVQGLPNTTTRSIQSGQPTTLTDSQGMSRFGMYAVGFVAVGAAVTAGATYLYNRYYNTDDEMAKKGTDSQSTEMHDQDSVNNPNTTINMKNF